MYLLDATSPPPGRAGWDLSQFGKDSTAFIGRQGRHMKRPGQVLEVSQGSLVAEHIGGNAIIVSAGTLAL
jgi:hypothetical protein